MADNKPGNREKVKEIVASIEGGIKDLFQSERYAEYLSTMSRFHNYSYRNTLLIHMQRPDATLVAGFNKWKNQFGRHVKKGEKGLTILAPTPFKKKIEETKRDPDTKAPLLDADGNIITEEKIVEIPMFRPVKVFDVKQTDGKPLPSLAVDLTGNVRHYEAFMDALRRASPVPIEFERMEGSESGYFLPSGQRIAVKEGMSQIQTVQVLIHEITHATLHNYEKNQRAASAGEDDAELSAPKDRSTEEVEAESVSYAVCQYYGIEVSARSLGYIASWSSGKELPELKSSLETISKTANALITSIDRHFAEICKERGIVLEQAEQDAPAVESPFVSEINKDTFWKLIGEAKRLYGEDMDGYAAWVESQLLMMEPEQSRNYDDIINGYRNLAYKYGLWTAAAVMLDGCTDDGFIDFRSWLIAQGKETYMAVLKDPDFLADVPLYGDGSFEILAYVGDYAYEKLTGKEISIEEDLSIHEQLEAELAEGIVYGDGIEYPYDWKDTAAYVPRLCAKYVPPDVLAKFVAQNLDTWNPSSSGIQQARKTCAKSSRVIKANAEPEEYLYCSEYNPQHVGKNDRRFIRARKPSELEMKPEQIIFCGSNEMCDKLLTLLAEGRLHRDDFFTVSSAVVSRYATTDGNELDVFTGPDDKVYLGKRNLYDNRGHYLNHDRSLLHVSDNPNMFHFLSGKGYTETQTEMLEEGYFTPEDYAEFAAMQTDALRQFVEEQPLLFAGEPFRFPGEDAPVREEAEALFLVDDAVYLHIQACDSGYDYTLYDKATMRQLDGGQIDPLDVDTHFSQGGLRPVADAVIVSTPNLTGDAVENAPLELVESLQDAAMREMREAVTWVKDTALDKYPLPDASLMLSDLEIRGYSGNDILPLTRERAAELLERDMTIYIVRANEDPEMIFDRDDLMEQPDAMLYAVPREEWEASPDFRQAVAERMNRQEKREAAFLNHAGDCFAIYQMKQSEETRFLHFEPMGYLREHSLTVDRANYDLVYTAPIEAPAITGEILDGLWERFNADHPADYCRPSMSISDIVALKLDGVLSCHYCDDVGFVELPDFIPPENYLKTAELSTEDDCNMIDGIINNGPKEPTAAELEAQAKAGQQISLLALAEAIQREKQEKKSVVAQLKGKQNRPKTLQKKNKEKER